MKSLLLAFALVLPSVSTVYSQEESKKQEKSEELKVLDRFLGTWDHAVVITHSEGGNETRYNTVSHRSWSMGGSFLRFEEKNIAQPEYPEFQMVLSYNPAKKTYVGVGMDGVNGSMVTATWDEKAEAMTFETKQGNGSRLKYTLRFLDENTAEAKGAFLDPEGDVMVNLVWKQTRRDQ